MISLNKFIIGSTIIFMIIFIFTYAASAPSGNDQQFNVVLMSLNAVRADHLGIYGYKRNTSPNIDKLAEEALIFDQAIAQSHWTLPSQASIFTSRYVHSHGVYERTEKLSEKELTLPEILKIYNYKTAAFVGGLDMVAAYGLNQGFDYYFDNTKGKPMSSFKEIIPPAIEWLRENKDNKFFLFIQGYDVHAPYHQPAPYEDMHEPDYNGIINQLHLDYHLLKNIHKDTLLFEGKRIKLSKEDINHIIAHYDAGISYVDKFIGELLKEINQSNLSDKTILIITSEHGEELSDHGGFDRFGQKNLYEEVIRIPLIIKHPYIEGRRFTNQVQHIDILPTILDFLGIPINKEAQGLSLAPLIEGQAIKKEFNRYVYSEASPNKWATRTRQWKLLYNHGDYELYNLQEDRAETDNLFSQRPELVYELAQTFLEWRKITKVDRSFDNQRIELSEEMKKNLREAGYW